MAQCKNCQAELPEGVEFCEQCGAPVNDKTKKEKKGRLGKREKANASVSAATPPVVDETTPLVDKDIEEEAKSWAKATGSLIEESDPVDLPTQNTTYRPDKRVVPSAVFIARTKNGVSDKFIGLLLFAVIYAIIVLSFMLNTGLLNMDGLLVSIKTYLPLLLLTLGGIVIARTGNVDISLPIVSVVTYFLLAKAFTETNIYPMMIMTLCIALFIGLAIGILSIIGKVPTIFSSFTLLFLGLIYLKILLDGGASFMAVTYTEMSIKIIPLALVIVSVMATFILVYMTNLGKPMFKRKGITNKNKWLYILSFGFAYFLAAGAGILASIHTALPIDFSATMFYSLDLVLGVLFVVALSGASTLFDNRSLPVLVTLLNFLAWFAVCFVLQNSVGRMQDPLVATAIKVAFVLLALITDRVYTKTHLGDFYQTMHVKK